MDGHELVAWIALTVLLLAIVLIQFDFARRALASLGDWVLVEITAEPEVDQDAVDLYHALRRQRLLEHVARLRRILADDSHQSAVRQLGNRLAYGQLLAELAELGEARRLPLTTADKYADSFAEPDVYAERTWSPTVAVAGRGGGRYAPRVEVLDLGRPRRS